MSAILKAGTATERRVRQNTYQFRDLEQEGRRIIDEARQRAAELISAAQVQAQQIREQARRSGQQQGSTVGYEEGLAKGSTEGLAEARKNFQNQHQHLVEMMTALCDDVERQRVDRLRSAERELVNFALGVARKVIKIEGQWNREVAPANLRAALEMVIKPTDLVVRVHPADLETMQAFATQQAEKLVRLGHLHLLADESLQPGDVRVETATGEIDARLDEQMEQIARTVCGRSAEA
ncbi:MAG: hypothetical protein HJJLKODD_01826 [Phycisphaerae bacterium]|nr:hypothetical protein [Phycisphaerae bacterium]